MKNMAFNFTQLAKYDDAFFRFLELRKRFFVDQLDWDIPHDDAMEMDQYDNPTAWYSLVEYDGEIVGGARTMPTNARWGSHGCMLTDAINGKLVDIPDTVLSDAVSEPSIWECTRLVISDDLDTQVERAQCLYLIVSGLVEMAASQQAQHLMSLSPLALTRALRQLGFGAKRIGAPYLNEGDGRRYAVLTMPAVPSCKSQAVVIPASPKPAEERQLAFS